MSTWNYRIVKYRDGSGYGLHEVYYNVAGDPCAMTQDPTSFGSDTDGGPEELIRGLSLAMSDASNRPVLEEPEKWAEFDHGYEEEEGEPVSNTEALNDRS